jgi:AcrR family transcriptional regulator
MVFGMVPAASSTPRRRKTQTERRAETRAALLDATVECLIAYGYAKTTTGRIAELAGLSRGAQLPYFRSRADIVSAAVAHLAAKRISAFNARFADRAVSVEECLDALWEEHQGPIFDAALELWVASRTDPDLRSNLVKIERDVAAAIAAAAESALGERARRPTFGEDLFYAMATIRGLALLQISNGVSSRTMTRMWGETRERLLRVLG